jgi:hypothetical protein
MVWCTPANKNKTPLLSSVIVVSCCVQTNSPCHVKSMGIVPMHEWKVPLKYGGMLPFPSGPLGLEQAADTMVWGLAGNVGKCVCRLHPSNDRHFCLSPTRWKCFPDTSVTFCYVGQFFGCRRRVGETCCRHTLLHVRWNQY